MTTMPLADVRAQLSKLVEAAASTHERIEITRNGRRAAVLLGAEDYDALQETIAALSNPELMVDLAQADADFASGNIVSADAMLAAMKAAGRPVGKPGPTES